MLEIIISLIYIYSIGIIFTLMLFAAGTIIVESEEYRSPLVFLYLSLTYPYTLYRLYKNENERN